MQQEEQKFLNDLDKRLWNAADRLRSNIDAAEYKHVVLGLIFLKYVSDAFAERREQLKTSFADPEHEYYLGDDADEIAEEELEIRDYYTEKNVFWVPALARWENLQNNAKVAPGTEIEIKNGKKVTYKFTSIGKLIDDALEEIEKENPKLKNVLDKNYARRQIDPSILGQLIDKIAEIPFQHGSDDKGGLHAKDILGHVYEYFLGQFALSEGKKGGQYYTPKAIVTLIVEMLQPWKGRVYDPAMGSGGFFVSSEKFIEGHEGKLGLPVRGTQTGNISVYGQESNPTTWRLAAMNMAIRGIDFNFGGEPANTLSNDKHPDLRADFVMANPPFNMKEWNSGVKDDDPRWQYGIPPAGNANFAWMQHMLYHLAPNGSLGLLLANGSMSSNTNNEGEIRKKLLQEDRVECMVALPGQLFTNTQIPACIWFLTKNKKAKLPLPQGEGRGEGGFRDRTGEVLFIDARNLGYMKDRVLRDFTPEDIKKIADTFHNWRIHPLPSPQGEGRGEGKKLPEKLLKNARELRKNQTDAEALLWSLLRNRQIENYKFRRQHPVEPYILDFYCHEKQLAIELDGGQHNLESAIAKDEKRTKHLQAKGIRVLRFWNNDVLQNIEAVLQSIYDALLFPPHPNPLPEGEGFHPSPSGRRAGDEGAYHDTPALTTRDGGNAGNAGAVAGTANQYENVPAFCYSATLEEIKKHDYVLTPGRYVGAAEEEDDGELFAEKMARLTAQLKDQFEQSDKLEAEIKKNLAGLGYEL